MDRAFSRLYEQLRAQAEAEGLDPEDDGGVTADR